MVLCTIIGGQVEPKIEMAPTETILDLKTKIEALLDVNTERQSLWYTNLQLVDDLEMRGYDALIDHEAITLTVSPLPPDMKLHVLIKFMHCDGYVRVKETDKVSDLRDKVSRYWGILPPLITLRRLNVVMEDHFPLSAYYINEASEVELSVSIPFR